jgi:hypothetical protein
MTAITRRAQAWQRVGVIADRQHGVISREQLRRLGFKDGAISHAATTGRLHRVFHGVYALGHARVPERGRLMAATLACGKGAVVSHRSAGALLGLLDKGPVVIDVIAPPSRGRGIDGIYLHRVRPPQREETGTFDGIPCTSPARTLVDLAGVVGEWTLRSAFERAGRRQGMLDIAAIERSIDPCRRGMKVLAKLIDEWRGAAPLLGKRGKLKARSRPRCCRWSLAEVFPLRSSTPRSRSPTAASRWTSSGPSTASSSRPTAATSTAPLLPSSATAGATAN